MMSFDFKSLFEAFKNIFKSFSQFLLNCSEFLDLISSQNNKIHVEKLPKNVFHFDLHEAKFNQIFFSFITTFGFLERNVFRVFFSFFSKGSHWTLPAPKKNAFNFLVLAT